MYVKGRFFCIESRFSGHMVKGQGQTVGLCTIDVCLISFDFSAGKIPNLVLWIPDLYSFSSHMAKG